MGSLGVSAAVGVAKECCGRLLGRCCSRTGHSEWISHGQAKLDWYPFWSHNVMVREAGTEERPVVGGQLVFGRPKNALQHGRQRLLCRQSWWATGPSCRWGASALQACGSICCLMEPAVKEQTAAEEHGRLHGPGSGRLHTAGLEILMSQKFSFPFVLEP